MWGHHGEGRKGCSSSLLHAGGWTGQFVEEQIGVAGAHLAGGHGCDAVERGGKSEPWRWGHRDPHGAADRRDREGPSLLSLGAPEANLFCNPLEILQRSKPTRMCYTALWL